MENELQKFEKLMEDNFSDIFQIFHEYYKEIHVESCFNVLKREKGLYLTNPQRKSRKVLGRLPSQDLSKSTNYQDSLMKKKLILMNNYYLIQTNNYSQNQTINYDLLANEINIYSRYQHITLANFRGYELIDKDGKLVPTIMIERPVNGPLLFLFDTIKQNKTKDKSNIQLSPINQDFYPHFNLNIDSIQPEQKFAIILGIIAGIGFIHKKNFAHLNLSPSTVYLNEHFYPALVGYAYNVPFKAIHQDEDIVEEEDNSEDTYEDENIKQIKDIFNLCPENKYKFLYYPDDNNENPKFDYPAYVAPEVFNKDPKKYFNELADIYSIGMLIYFILTENEPVINDKKQVELPLLDNLHEPWNTLIKKCLSNDPNDRYTAQQLFNELTVDDKIGLYLSTIPNSDTNELSKTKSFITYLIQDMKSDENNSLSDLHGIIPSLADISYDDRLIIYAAEKGNEECLEIIGHYFYEGTHNFLKDDACAFYCFNKVIYRIPSRLKCAEFLQNGIGTKKNLIEALKIYNEILKNIDETNPLYTEIKKKIKETEKEYDETHSVKLLNYPEDKKQQQKINSLIVGRYTTLEENKILHTKVIRFETINSKICLINKYKKFQDKFQSTQVKQVKESIDLDINYFSSLSKTGVPEVKPDDFTVDTSRSETGSSGTIYRATDKRDQKTYVVKVFHTIPDDDIESRNKIKRELILSKQFDHSTILKILGFCPISITSKLRGNPTLIMNYIPNGSLEKMIKSESRHRKIPKWDNTAKLKVIIGIAYAMACIHCKHFIHRDLKPENILLDEDFKPVIGDFGSSKEFSPNDNIDMTNEIGTYYYMAPEVYIKARSYKWEVDVYSFGIILYQIIKGLPIERIYSGNKQVYFLQYIRTGYTPDVDDMHKLFQEIITSCWNNKIDARLDFQSIYIMLTEAVSENEELLPDVDINEVNRYISSLEG